MENKCNIFECDPLEKGVILAKLQFAAYLKR